MAGVTRIRRCSRSSRETWCISRVKRYRHLRCQWARFKWRTTNPSTAGSSSGSSRSCRAMDRRQPITPRPPALPRVSRSSHLPLSSATPLNQSLAKVSQVRSSRRGCVTATSGTGLNWRKGRNSSKLLSLLTAKSLHRASSSRTSSCPPPRQPTTTTVSLPCSTSGARSQERMQWACPDRTARREAGRASTASTTRSSTGEVRTEP